MSVSKAAEPLPPAPSPGRGGGERKPPLRFGEGVGGGVSTSIHVRRPGAGCQETPLDPVRQRRYNRPAAGRQGRPPAPPRGSAPVVARGRDRAVARTNRVAAPWAVEPGANGRSLPSVPAFRLTQPPAAERLSTTSTRVSSSGAFPG